MKLHSDFPQFRAFAATLAVLVLLAGCNYVPKVDPYRMEILQGNLLTQEMVAKLRVGLTKDQVRFVLGTPLVVDSFHDNRWDYVYLHMPENVRIAERRRVTVFFEEGKLKRIDGDVVSAVPGAPDPSAVVPSASATAAPEAK